ncbi:PrsW family intramembrane metalloprotease [Mycolicibacterium sp. J2]|uniref:PrsW family intramembrane metalloprotease n=1 Tax=Mycolicibacterium sp. J2 TaxID=2993511 RepID=UPI00224B5F83|nr:PrsW family intramembrane metalloprotease [Mycolicibacterium sp. J2]MCX2715487.1 PrsW family intramembrane metalloprotease [Mycolicibacterium sp. J2]
MHPSHLPHPPIPPWPRRARAVGAPLAVLIGLGTITGLLIILLTLTNPVGTAIGFVLSTAAITVVVLSYLWLDRWEPEPTRLLQLAFIWGASLAIVVSLIFELWADAALTPIAGLPEGFESTAIRAPLIEEAAKGLFLLVMMTGRRRNELNSLTDCLVYAGLVGAGFAWLEDILYIANGESVAHSLVTAALRLVMAPFAHSLFTTFTGIGVYFALRQRGTIGKVACIAVGYGAAVVMHMLWNGSSLLGVETYFAVYVLWMVPIFGLGIALGVYSRRREQRVVAEKLPGMVAAGLITANEATWLGSLRSRKQAIAEVTRHHGKPAGRNVRDFAAQVVELAFVRDRIDRGFGDARVQALLNEEAYWVHGARASAPALGWLTHYRAPLP